jgi:hypothetical protein
MAQQTHVVWPKWDPNRSTRATFLDMAQEVSAREQRPYLSLDGYNTLMMRPRSPISMSRTRDWRSEAFRSYCPVTDPNCVSPVDQYSPAPLPKRPREPPVKLERSVHKADPAARVPRPGDVDRDAFFAKLYATKSTYDRRAQKLKRRLEGWDALTGRAAALCSESRESWERVKRSKERQEGLPEKPDSILRLAASAPSLAR